MKKLCRGEKTGLKIEIKVFSFLLLAFSFFTESYSQIPINGFCKFNSYAVDKDYTSIFPLNFNRDSQTDLLLFNSQKKELISLVGDKGGSFNKKYHFNIPYEITDLYNITDSKGQIISAAFTSRKSRSIGIYDFYSNGRPALKKIIKFDSYPDYLSIGDIDGGGIKSYLISGSAFNGLSLLRPGKNNKFLETKIVSNLSFGKALFVDLSNNGYPDIVASNILNRSLDFYYNNGSGEFAKVRSIKINSEIKSLQSFDVNLDNYFDLIFSSGNSINIYYGDSVGSYDNKYSISTIYKPDKFVFGDFNKDGFIDIAYANFSEGTVSILFAKNDGSFYPEIIYLRKSGLKDIIPFYSKFVNGIYLISNEGFIYSITTMSSISDDLSISLGAKPGAISNFDLDNNGITDIVFIDGNTNSLKLIIRNNAGIPWTLYKIKLFEMHSRIVVDNKDPLNKIFYCYTPGEKIIEVINENFKTGSVNRNSLYTPGNINDVMIYSDEESKSSVFVSYLNNNNLSIRVFQNREFRYNNEDFRNIDSGVFDANLSNAGIPEIFYWKKEDSAQVLYSAVFKNNFKSRTKYFRVSLTDTTLINSFSGDLLNKGEITSINLFETPKNDFALISSLKNPSIIVNKDLLNHFRIKNKNQLFFGELKPGGLKKLFIYVSNENALHSLDFVNKGKEIVIWKLLEVKNVGSFFIKKMSPRSYNIVYTDSLDNCIKIKEIAQ